MAAIQFTDQPRAIDDEGRLLVDARMSFYAAADDAILPAYADPALTVPLPWPLPSDAAGRFTPLWIPDDVDYRITLTDSGGSEVWDLDPFNSFPGSISGLPLDDSGRAMPFASYTFFWAGTTIKATVYSDDTLTSTLSSPVTADAAGQVPDIWLDDELHYRVVLRDGNGVLIYDIDDYQVMDQAEVVPPGAPVLSGEMSSLIASLTWTAASAGTFPIDHYLLYKSISGGAYSLLATIDVDEPREYDDSGLSYDTVYSYYVVAVDSDENESALSNVVDLEEDPPPLTTSIIAVGHDTTVLQSFDAISWNIVSVPAATSYLCAAYSPSIPIQIIAGSNVIASSNDSETWTARTSPSDANWRGAAYSPSLGLFVLVADSSTASAPLCATSSDGITWTAQAGLPQQTWQTVIWSEFLGLFIAGATSGTNRIATSPDGVTWTTRATPSGYTVYSLASSGSVVCGISRGHFTSIYSSDGISWTESDADFSAGQSAVTFGAGVFVSVDIFNGAYTSSDGSNWFARTPASALNWEGVCYSAALGLFIAVAFSDELTGSVVMTSPNGITWTSQPTPAGANNSGWTDVVASQF